MSNHRQIKVAVLQTAPKKGAPDENRSRALEALQRASEAGARLIALPECAISGYAISTTREAIELAEPLAGPTTEAIVRHCASTGTHVAFGLLERDGEFLFNSAILVGPNGVIGRHRKAHIAPVGADRFVTPGASIDVFEALGIRIGMLICYEVRFPEICRVMALKGAQLLIVAANWPAGAHVNPDIMTPARAAENNVHILAANRCGTEGPLSFIGKSAILAPTGSRIASAGDSEEMISATIEVGSGLGELSVADSGYAVDLRKHRRPELYQDLARGERA
jgi:predicted amidohydrolase